MRNFNEFFRKVVTYDKSQKKGLHPLSLKDIYLEKPQGEGSN